MNCISEKVHIQVCNDQEKAQSERNFQSKNEVEKTKWTNRYLENVSGGGGGA